jgi:hypothetical protein
MKNLILYTVYCEFIHVFHQMAAEILAFRQH